MKKTVPFILAGILTAGLFWQYFVRGHVPAPFAYQMVWYEPWKTDNTKNGVPAIPHKAVADDVFRQIVPFRRLASDALSRGIFPLWNPYNGSGQPLFATLHTGIANPFTVAELRTGTGTGWSRFVILQMPLLFLATFFYMRTLGTTVLASLTSATVLALSGVATTRYAYGDYMYALAGLPLLLGLIERRKLHAVPFVTAFVLVSVQPQIAVYVLLTALLYAGMRLKGERTAYMLLTAIGAGVAAFQLVPTTELFLLANVNTDSSGFIFRKFLMPATHLISLFIPNYFGNSGTYNFWGSTDFVETVIGIGMIPVALALFARKGNVRSFFLWGTVITILLTLDWFLPRLLYGLPLPVLSTSIPTRIYLLTAFFIAVLAGLGMDERPARGPMVGVGIAGIVMLFASRLFSCPPEIPACHGVAFRNGMLEFGVFAAGSVLLFVPKAGKAAVLLMLVASGLYNGWKFLPMSPRRYAGADHAVIRELRRVAPDRVAGTGSGAFATDFATAYRYFDTNYYDPLYVRRYGELVSYVNTGSRTAGLTRSDINVISDATVSADIAFRRDRFWDLTGTSVLAVKKGEYDPCRPKDPLRSRQCETVWEDTEWKLKRRETALPRAYLVTDVRAEPDPERALKLLFDPDTDSAVTALTEVPVPGVRAGRTAAGSADITDYAQNRITIETVASRSAFLVLSDTQYPGWVAEIDGIATQNYRANYAFRGVVIPEGPHTVVFRYDPPSLRYGMAISVISVAVWLLYAWYGRGTGTRPTTDRPR